MFAKQDFVTCIIENLAKRGFGAKRAAGIIDRFEGLSEGFKAQGHNAPDAMTLAMSRVFAEVAQATHDKARLASSRLRAQAEIHDRVAAGVDPKLKTSAFIFDGRKGGPGVAIARAAISMIDSDPRFKGTSYVVQQDLVRNQLFAVMDDVFAHARKGAFGVQRGKAYLDNVARELKGQNTGDKVAKDIAASYTKAQELGVDLFNAAGGVMSKLKDFGLPQRLSASRVSRAKFDAFRDVMTNALDWDKMRWPDGSPIEAADRDDVLREVFRTLTSNGANKIDPAAFRGRGHAVGNALDQHRFMQFKDGEAWLRVHEAFGDGNVFDVMVSHIDSMAHKIALVRMFGPNPGLAADNIRATVRKVAEGLPADVRENALVEAEAIMKNRFNTMFDIITHKNPMDPESFMGNMVVGASNLLNSAILGSASVLAIPSDWMLMATTRKYDGLRAFGGVGYYVKSLRGDAVERDIAVSSGFIYDDVVLMNYAMSRYTGMGTYGPSITRGLSEATMRASLLAGHTRAARWSAQAEFMAAMGRYVKTDFDALPFKRVLDRYGITRQEWETFATTTPYMYRGKVAMLRPIDLTKTRGANDAMFQKFQGMLLTEARNMILESSVEAQSFLRATTRPDTLAGALLHSFSMWKNFPITFQMTYGRLAMTAETAAGKMAFVAALGAGMIGVGALGLQLRELAKGKDPLPMNDFSFWGRALLAGGGLGIWGDMLFTGVNDYGRSPAEVFAGPLVSLAGDTANLAFGDGFAFLQAMDQHDDFKSKTLQRAVAFAERYTPGSSIWWARLALQREIWDKLELLADPNAYYQRQRRAQRTQQTTGQGSWWAPGNNGPQRAPQFGGYQ